MELKLRARAYNEAVHDMVMAGRLTEAGLSDLRIRSWQSDVSAQRANQLSFDIHAWHTGNVLKRIP